MVGFQQIKPKSSKPGHVDEEHIDKEHKISKPYRKFGVADETMSHTAAECTSLAQNDHTNLRYDKIVAVYREI